MDFSDFWLKTLEFPYGSMPGILETGHDFPDKTGPDPS